VAWENSSVVARGNSSVVAWENSSVEASGNSSVVARGNSSVETWGNSSVVAWENSSVEAWGNSSVEARGNSSVELFISAYAIILSSYVVVKKVLDYSTAIFKGCKENTIEKSDTAISREIPSNINPTFDEWLRRGYVFADGITKKLKSQKNIGEITVFEVQGFPKKTTSYVVRKGDLFSHGDTVEKAIEDLRYKVGNRDTSEFERWKNNLEMEVSIDDAIAAYRTITGACEMGTKEFVKSIQIPEKLTPKIIVELTQDRYGNNEFKRFLGVENS
jgi:hypothetical protein